MEDICEKIYRICFLDRQHLCYNMVKYWQDGDYLNANTLYTILSSNSCIIKHSIYFYTAHSSNGLLTIIFEGGDKYSIEYKYQFDKEMILPMPYDEYKQYIAMLTI